MSVYIGEFESWGDVVDEFGLDPLTPEPDDVFAAYEEEGYEGIALVIIRKPGGLFDVVEGSHCSCYGLDGQFDPTVDMPKAAVVEMLKRGNALNDWGDYYTEALGWLEA